MLYNQPTGGGPNDPYVGKNTAAGIQGSKVPPGAVEFPQREIMSVINAAIAAGLPITPTNADLAQLLKAIAFLIPKYAPTLPGAAANGGLVKNSSGDFLLGLDNLPVETAFASADKIALYTEESEDGLGAATPFATTVGSLGSFIAALFKSTATFTQLTPTNLAAMSLQTGDIVIPQNTPTVLPLVSAGIDPSLGSITNGTFTAKRAGYYLINASGASFLSSSGHASDAGTFTFEVRLTPAGTNSPTGSYQTATAPITSGGGQAIGQVTITTITHMNVGDEIAFVVIAKNQYGDATSVGASGYSNMLVALLNS